MRRAPRLSLTGASTAHLPRLQRPAVATLPRRPQPSCSLAPLRPFSSFRACRSEDSSAKAKALNQKSLDEHENSVKSQIDDKVGQAEEKQLRTPWHREGSDKPPVRRFRSASAMTKGSFLCAWGASTKWLIYVNRKATHDAFETAEVDPPSHNTRQERRSKIN